MGQNFSRPGSWLDALKLTLLTISVGAVQWVRWQLALADRQQDYNSNRNRHRSRRYTCSQEEHQATGKGGLLAGMPPELRQAALNLIDYQLTPILVDQWRVTLVELLFASQNAPPLPETDPQLRQALLESLKSYEEQQARQPAFSQRSQVQVPERTRVPPRLAAGPSWAARAGHSSASGPARTASAEHSAASTSGPLPSAKAAQARPSAPPMPVPILEDATPSAPPMPEQVAQESAASSSSQKEEQPDMECHICMDADVEVENDLCHHRMCIPCAKAVCSLPERAPQCPFCRAAITKLLPL